MLLGSPAWASRVVLLTWKVSVTKSGRSWFRLAPSAPLTDGTDYSWLPTPNTVGGHTVGTWRELGGSGNPHKSTDFGKMYRNPDYEEWRMGFPIGWTDLTPSGMP
jgi:hypothetical protein